MPARLRPEFDLHFLTDPVALQRLLRQVDGDLALTIGRQHEGRLTGRHHLADLDAALGDQPIAGGPQHRIIDLVAGHVELSPRLLQSGRRGAVGIVGIVELRLADQLTTEQRLIAVVLRLGHPQVGFRCGHLGTHAVQLQAHVLRIEACQRLVLAHTVTRFDQAFDDLAPMRKASSGS